MKKRKVETISARKWKRQRTKQKKWDKKHPVLAYLRDLKYVPYRLNSARQDLILSIKSFIQRGKRGWSNRDVWGLSDYLSDTIAKTVYHLKEHHSGFPPDLTEGKWIDILNIIVDAFELTHRYSNGNLYLIRSERKRKILQKSLDKINKKHNSNYRCMTDKEIQTHDKGWELLKKYFIYLWD